VKGRAAQISGSFGFQKEGSSSGSLRVTFVKRVRAELRAERARLTPGRRRAAKLTQTKRVP
jgi:hypothetical protein